MYYTMQAIDSHAESLSMYNEGARAVTLFKAPQLSNNLLLRAHPSAKISYRRCLFSLRRGRNGRRNHYNHLNQVL